MPTITAPADPNTLVQEAVRKITTIATLPEITVRIIRLVEDPNSSAKQLHQIVSHDPALVARIMKVVNSAFYGLPGQIGSVDRAIVLVGLNAVKNIAVAASMGQLFRSTTMCDLFTPRDLWKHCISVGVCSRELSRYLKLPLGEEAFLAGMIHDIGVLMHMQQNPEKLREVCQLAAHSGADFCQAERELIGVDHQQLGLGLTAHWKFPKTCQQVAGFHHNPAVLGDEGRQLVTLVHVADTLCCQTQLGFNLTALNQTIDEAMLAEIGLDRPALEQVAVILPSLVSDAMTVMS